MKKCPYCDKRLFGSDYTSHILKNHIEKVANSISTNPSDLLTTDDSGIVIRMSEFADLHGEARIDFDWDKRYRNFKSALNMQGEKSFQKIAQSKEVHLPPSKQSLKIECRYCHKIIEKDKIKEHNALKHFDDLPSNSKPSYRKVQKPKEKDAETNDVTFAPEGEEGNIAEKLKQALDEPRYGAKGMHHRHEWDGKFGSTPLHDDYGDESDGE